MLISLFTVRVLLKTLGVEDYGIYNVVGGLVTFLSFLTLTMSSATQRYLSFSLGNNDKQKFQQLFSMNILIYFFLSIVIIVLAETIGLWFLNNYLNVPPERLIAANWVYQFSLITFVINMLIIPYNSAILSHERMTVYAYVSILDAILKLIIVYLIVTIKFDKLIIYGLLLLIQVFLISGIYVIYCNRKLQGCRFVFFWDRKLFREILGYTGWTLFGSLSGTLNNQGLSLILNVFFGPVINAAKGIADRVSSAVTSFISNFYSAIKPQIVKSYASGNYEYMKDLAFKSSKLSYYLMFVLSLPLILETKYILSLWLGKVEPSMISFTQLILIFSLINVFEFPLTQLVHATGRVKKYQLYVGIVTLITLPVTSLALKLGFPAETAIIVLILVYLIAYIPRLIIVQNQLHISIKEYLIKVIFRVVIVTIFAIILPLLIVYILDISFKRLIISVIVSFISVAFTVFLIGINQAERTIAIDFLRNKLRKINN